MGICEVCKDLAVSAEADLVITTKLFDIDQKAAQGCQTCRMLAEGLSDFDMISKDEEVRLHGAVFPSGDASLRVANHGLEIVHYEGDDCPWPVIGSRKWPLSQPTLNDYVRFIRTQDERCKGLHELCTSLSTSRGSGAKVYVPTRLIDVGGGSNGPRLIESRELAAEAFASASTYVALSHCWGPHQIITTTSATLGDRKAGIAWADLSKTFQGALTMTRALDVRFIWIDSLCIIQNSVEDWANEAAQMAFVYRNANLTVSATSASSGQEGFLTMPRPANVEVNAKHGDRAYKVFFTKTIYTGAFYKPNAYTDGRGWTLQEQMLSPRVIHFTREELVWDYYGGQARECVDGGSAADVVKSRFGLALQNASLRSQAWREMLELYSSRQLTFHKDRLPAVSGVASEFAESTGAYHSGHWESELPFSLLWVCKYGPGERVKGTSDPPSNPPSWSWASMESTHISWQRWLRHNLNSDLVTVVEVLDVFTKPSTADPRGLVAKGMVTLRGKLYPLDFEGDKLCQPGHYEVAGLACAMQEDVPLSTIRSDMQRTGTQLHYLTIATSPTGNQGLYLLCHREVADGPDMPAQMSARTVGVGSLLRKADFNAYTTTTVGIS